MFARTGTSYSSYAFFLFLLITLPAAALSPMYTNAPNPVGRWTFDDASGVTAADSSPNGHPATLVNGVSWVAGHNGTGIAADSSRRQYVSIPAIDLSTTNAVTVTLWTKRTYSTIGAHVLFEASEDSSNSTTGFGLFPDDAVCSGMAAGLRGDVGKTVNCYAQPTSGVWHHLAIVFDKSQTGGNQAKLYIDGISQNPTRSLYAATNTNKFGNNPLYLFSRRGTTQFTSGEVRDLQVFDRALTATQVSQNYNAASQIGRDFVVSTDGVDSITTSTFTTSINGEPLVAFVSYDGPSNLPQTATVTGGGLNWRLVQRSNHQWGTAEIWMATAPNAPFRATATSRPGYSGSYHGSLTVVGFTNASGVGMVGQASGASGAPDVVLQAVPTGNWVFAVGNDWNSAKPRTPVSGQTLVHQKLDTQVNDTYWVQSTTVPSTTYGSVDIHDSAPTTDEWNYAAVAIVPKQTTQQGTLSASPTSLSFGNVNVNSSLSLTVTIINTGTASTTVTGVTASGQGYSYSGVTPPFTLLVGQSVSITVTFSPTVVGLATGTLTINSNASNPILTIPLSGTGVSTRQHSVTLSWNASTSQVSGYNVYRSTSSNGHFTKLNNSLIVPTTYVDTSVVSRMTYYYYATSVDGRGNESVPSNQSVATIP